MKSVYGPVRTKENAMRAVFLFCAVFSVLALTAITVFLLAGGVPFIAKTGVGRFLLGTDWQPLSDNPVYGIFPMIVTTLYVTALSVVTGLGTGLLTAVCLYRFCPKRLVLPIRQMINLLAGIPSVIFGLFGMTVIVPFIRDYLSPNGVGYGILSSSIVLGIMVLPTIVSVSLDAMQAVPESYYEGALALGATHERGVYTAVVPAARSGILAGVVLGVGRAMGETMAVIMVAGNQPRMPKGILQGVRTLTGNIVIEMGYATGLHREALIATGVVLFVFILLMNLCFSVLKRGKKA